MKRKRIILADDDSTIHFPLTYYLSEAGYEVAVVMDGMDAYDAIWQASKTESPFELLITDIEMPGLSGLELVDSLEKKGLQLPVLVITGYGDRKTMADLAEKGCRNYLIKPINEEDLLNRVAAIFSSCIE